MNKSPVLYLYIIILVTLYSSPLLATEGTDQRLKRLEDRVETIASSNIEIKENIKQTLAISGDTVKYVGNISSILLPFILLSLGYQIYRSYQFEKEIRETRKLMVDEYGKMIEMRSSSEKLILEIKKKTDNLEDFVGSLAADILQKKTPGLFAEVKEQASQAIAEIRTKEEDLAKSIELMKKYESLDLTLTPTLYLERGNIYFGQNNLDKAIENFNEGIKLKPDDKELHFRRGLTYHKAGRYTEAITDYEKVVSLDRQHHDANANLGVCYREINILDKALLYFDSALKINPTGEFTLIHRSRAYRKFKKYDLAISDLESAIRAHPKSITPLIDLGLIYGEKGDCDRSKEYYSRAIKVDPKSAVARTNLAEIYICTKEYSKAEKLSREVFSDETTTRSKIMSKYITVLSLICEGKDYKADLTWLVTTLKETKDFVLGDWSFTEIMSFIKDQALQGDKAELIKKIVGLIKQEIKPEDFNV